MYALPMAALCYSRFEELQQKGLATENVSQFELSRSKCKIGCLNPMLVLLQGLHAGSGQFVSYLLNID